MKIKTTELIGRPLDWAVDAILTGDPMRVLYKKDGSGEWTLFDRTLPCPDGPPPYSTDWALAGKIIEQERMSFSDCIDCFAAASKKARTMYGPTHTIAAMRCFVAANLGDTVDVPDELVEETA